jgi:LysR family cyn operon transcriptional activator
MDRNLVFPRALRYFLAVAEYGSFTRAAEMLYVSQPTLSQQIKQLEQSLGVDLLDRSGRSVRLTDAGEVYLRHARRALGELDAGTRAINDVKDLRRGSLRVGWTPITDYLACSLLAAFNRQYPGIVLSTFEMPQTAIELAVAEDRIDVGIVFSGSRFAESPSSEIEAKVLFQEALVLAVGAAHARAAEQAPIGAQELAQEPLVLLNANFALRRHIDRHCQEHGIALRIAMETDSLSVIIEMVQGGSLATVLPETIIRTQCGLYPVKLSPPMPPKTITVISRRDGYKSPACLAFTAMAAEWPLVRHGETLLRRMRSCPLARKASHEEIAALAGKDAPDGGARD